MINNATEPRRGLFNMPVNFAKYFGRVEQRLKIYRGSKKLQVLGKINRTENTNAPFESWEQSHYGNDSRSD